jgi:TP901 family phage tail tape measure protein
MPDYDLGTARGRIELDASSLGRAQAAFATLGRSLLGFSAVAVGGFGYVVKQAADFEKTMSAVQAVTNANDQQMKGLSDTALELANRSAFGAQAIAGSFEDLGKAGISVQEIMGGAAEATIKLAEAAGDELPGGVTQGAEIIANALKTFEMGADQAMHFADVLVGAAASSTLSVDDIAVSMRYAGPIANQLGLSIDDLATTLAILGDQGIKGSTAGTSLRGVLLSLAPTSKKAKNQLKDLGLITEDGSNKFFDAEGNLKSFSEVLWLLQDATKDLTEEQKVNAFNTIFQRRAMNSALILADKGAAGFREYGDAIAGLNAADIASTKLDNLSGDMTILRNKVDALVISVGQEFQDMLREWVQAISEIVDKLAEVDPKILATILKYVAVAGAIAGALGVFALFIAGMVGTYRQFVVLAEGIKLVYGAMKLLLSSLLLNPWFLLAAAIAGIAIALYNVYQRGGAFAEWWDRMFERFRPAIDTVRNFVTNFVEQFQRLWDALSSGNFGDIAGIIDSMFGGTGRLIGPIEALGGAISELWNDFSRLITLLDSGKANLANVASTIDDIFGSTGRVKDFIMFLAENLPKVATWFTENIVPALQSFGSMLLRVFGAIFNSVVPWAVGVIKDMADFFKEIWPEVQATWEVVSEWIGRVFNSIVTIIGQAVTIIVTLWRAWGDDLLNMVGTVWNYIQETIENAIQFIQGVIRVFLALIRGDWGAVWEGIKDMVGAVWDQMGNIISTAVGLIRATITGFISTIQEIWSWVWEQIKNVVSAAWTGIINAIEGAITAVVLWFAGLWGRIKEVLVNLGADILIFFGKAWGWILTAAETAWRGLKAWLAGLPQMIVNAIGDLGELLVEAGKDLMEGLRKGIEDNFGIIETGFKILTGQMPSWKGPPSKDKRLLTPNGKLVMEGFLTGLRSMFPEVQKLMSSVAPGLQASVATTYNSGAGSIDYGALAAAIAGSINPAPLVGEQNFYGDPYGNAREVNTELKALARRGR